MELYQALVELFKALDGAKKCTSGAIRLQYSRSVLSNVDFLKALYDFAGGLLNVINIPKEHWTVTGTKTALDEMKHNLLLDFFRQYLHDNGVIHSYAMSALENTSFHFMVADGSIGFNTSDNPAFVYNRNDGLKNGIMPITPEILLVQGKCNSELDKYYITHILENEVRSVYGNIKIPQRGNIKFPQWN